MTGLEIVVLCLALNIYFEARGESDEGQIAVAQVVLNRARKTGRTPCEEVYSPYQFSWTLEHHGPVHPNDEQWIKAQFLAQKAYYHKDVTGKAYWYHANHITPWWVWNKVITKKIGNHIFYKCKPKHQCNWR